MTGEKLGKRLRGNKWKALGKLHGVFLDLLHSSSNLKKEKIMPFSRLHNNLFIVVVVILLLPSSAKWLSFRRLLFCVLFFFSSSLLSLLFLLENYSHGTKAKKKNNIETCNGSLLLCYCFWLIYMQFG